MKKTRKFILKNEKKMILQPNNKIFIDELVNAVNMNDKKYGLKLKHPDVWCDPRNYREVLETKSETNIAALICAINGLEVNDYFVTDEKTGISKMVKPIGIEEPVFTDASILKWNDKKSKYKTNSLLFKCRYSTLVLSRFLGKMGKITRLEADKKYKYKHSKDERRIVMTKNITKDITLFSKLMMQPNSSYGNIILKMHEHTSYCKKKNNHVKLREYINGHVLDIRRGMESNLLLPRFYDDDFAIWMIVKAAYLLATNNPKMKPVPSFKKLEGATVEHDLINVIEDLGAIILDNRLNGKFSPMFKAFVESRPIVMTEYYKEAKDDFVLRTGILALGYAKFVLDNKECDKFIDRMLCRGRIKNTKKRK